MYRLVEKTYTTNSAKMLGGKHLKEILNTLHEIEETALKLLITIDKDKQMILDEYSKDYEVFLEQENKKRQ